MLISGNDLLGAGILAGIFGLVILVAEIWARTGRPSPEAVRKFVHINCGIACLFFPFLVESPLVVFGLSLGFFALFVAGRKKDFLRCLNSVSRESYGSEYYPFAIAMLFALSIGNRWLYISSVLVLAVADAFAALIGKKYGAMHYHIGEASKSVEGSFFFWITAFLALHIPMLLLSDLPRETCVLAALLVSFLLTCIEAVSIRGTDNIFVPVMTCYVLLKITTKPPAEILFQCASLFLIFLIMGFVIWKTKTARMGGAIIYLCLSYAAWSLGSGLWAMPLLAGFILYIAARKLSGIKACESENLSPGFMISIAIIPLAILVFSNAFHRYDLGYGPFLTVTALSTALGIQAFRRRHFELGRAKSGLGSLLAGTVSCLSMSGILWLLTGNVNIPAVMALLAVVLTLGMIHNFFAVKNEKPQWSTLDFVVTVAAGLAYFAFQHFFRSALWPQMS